MFDLTPCLGVLLEVNLKKKISQACDWRMTLISVMKKAVQLVDLSYVITSSGMSVIALFGYTEYRVELRRPRLGFHCACSRSAQGDQMGDLWCSISPLVSC
jgi:hypothetical protein